MVSLGMLWHQGTRSHARQRQDDRPHSKQKVGLELKFQLLTSQEILTFLRRLLLLSLCNHRRISTVCRSEIRNKAGDTAAEIKRTYTRCNVFLVSIIYYYCSSRRFEFHLTQRACLLPHSGPESLRDVQGDFTGPEA